MFFVLPVLYAENNFYNILQSYHDIGQEVFLSLPVVLGANGVIEVVQQKLEDKEKQALHKSAGVMTEVQAGLVM